MRERLAPLPRLILEVQLQCELDFTRITWPARIGPQNRCKRVGDLSERTWRANIRIRIPEIGMIEGIEEFSPKLQLISFRKLELFEQAQVPHLDSGTIKLIGSTCTELPGTGLRKRGRIDDEPCGCIQVVISCRARVWIPYTVRIHGVIAVH